MKRAEIQDYEDIINLPHHQSDSRPHMSMSERAAQFSPFAALTGHRAIIEETIRRIDEAAEIRGFPKEN